IWTSWHVRDLSCAQRKSGKVPGLPEATPLRPVEKVAVIGAGTMGGGIAMALADSGLAVTLIENQQEALDRGRERIARSYAGSVAKGRLAQDEADRRLARVTPAVGLDAAAGAD